MSETPPAKKQKLDDTEENFAEDVDVDFAKKDGVEANNDGDSLKEPFVDSDKFDNFIRPEELEKLREFKVLDEVKSNDEDSDDEESDEDDDAKSEGVPEEEIEKMLEEDLPDDFKVAPKPKEKPYITRQKPVLEEKGVNQFEVLPLDWMMVRHYSGMPVYMHRGTRVCTLAKPYALGKGNTRRHDIPISAIPCYAYRRALEEEEKQREIDESIKQQIESGSWANKYRDKTDQAKENQSNNINLSKQSLKQNKEPSQCPFKKPSDNRQSNDPSGPSEKEKDLTEQLAGEIQDLKEEIIIKEEINMEIEEISQDIKEECAFDMELNTKNDKVDGNRMESECNVENNAGKDASEELNCFADDVLNNDNVDEIRTEAECDNLNDPLKYDSKELNSFADDVVIYENVDEIRTEAECDNLNDAGKYDSKELNSFADDVVINENVDENIRESGDNVVKDASKDDSKEQNEGENNEKQAEAEEEIPLNRQPVVLPGGIVMPPPRVETVNTSWKTQQLTHEQVNDYCKRLFKFKTVNIMHFRLSSTMVETNDFHTEYRRWADRRKYAKARKTLQCPTLPEGTKLITIPAQPDNGQNGGKSSKRDWVMNMNGRSYLSVFHEYVRRALQKQPVYEFKQLENASSPYQATVYIGGMQYGSGRGSSKRQAKSAAARASIHILIPEMRQELDAPPADPDFSFFDYVGIEDPRISEFCAATCEPSPHAILRTCLLRNFGAQDRHIHTEMKKLEYQKIELTMRVGRHSATVVCKNKKAAKQRASQAILQALHPHVRSWGSLLRLYGSRSVKSCKEKKIEEQQITLLQDKARHNEPNYAVLEKLRLEMRALRERDAAVVPIGTLLVRERLPEHSGSNLNNVTL